MTKAKGFTLLEVLVALLVLAVVMAGVMSFTTRHSMNTQYLRDRSIAHWVAMNELVRLQLRDELPDIGTSTGEVSMAGRLWFWRQKIETTPNKVIRRISIEVSPRQDFEQALSSLSAFVGKSVIPLNIPAAGLPDNTPAAGEPDNLGSSGPDITPPDNPVFTPDGSLPPPG